MTYFNEWDDYASQWLANLFSEGEVDSRSIHDVAASDLKGFGRCHFFAGIGGWELALEMADWPSSWEVWTGSCPCQPFSISGKKKGFDDDRHLWPEFRRLISERRPATVFGEQVASPLGRDWLARVHADMEALGYQFAAADLCAASVGAPHVRQRLWWVAHLPSERRREAGPGFSGQEERASWDRGMGQPDDKRLEGWSVCESQCATQRSPWKNATDVACVDGVRRRVPGSGVQPLAYGIPRSMGSGGTESRRVVVDSARTNRKGRLRAYGNAIVPQVAAVFIRSFMEAVGI